MKEKGECTWIKYRGFELHINGNFYPGEPQTHIDPSHPPEFEALEVWLGDWNILDLVEDNIEDIEKLALEKL